ncbi:immunoglobulin-like domain-containing protein [Virgibacillus halophilus]|uniref:Immunoglobulin-like domain-containing protein n=1 Tax=Tigheibacillus halophilus TaxID=361280 RepID=A0ABU5C3P6_9BACI|nr:immunoglobulin-like domain-containing protein [Virgibacillus halophilus]
MEFISIKKRYSLPINKLKTVIHNKGTKTAVYDNSVYLDKLQDGGWVQIPYKDDLDFYMEVLELKPGEISKQEVTIENLDYELTDGEYRIRKSMQVGAEKLPLRTNLKLKIEPMGIKLFQLMRSIAEDDKT